MMQHVDLSTCEELTATIVEWLRAYSVAHKYKIVGVGIDRRGRRIHTHSNLFHAIYHESSPPKR